MSDIEDDEPPPVLLPCSICSRTFRPDVLDRHRKVCEKTASKKRRVFDSFKSRVSGTELEEFLGPAPLPGQAPKRPDKSPAKKPQNRSKWKETHENLIAVLRAARGAATEDPAAAAAIFSSANAGNEQCPSCGRYFGPRAFDRHVQFCKEKTSRIKLTPSKVSQAQERLEARTKYKAPLSLKPKLTTKEKYSPMLPRKVESSETCSITSNTSNTKTYNSVNRNTNAKPAPVKNNSNFLRQSPTRSSERQRSISPKKPLVSSSSKVTREMHGKHVQPKIKENLKESDDLRPRTSMKMTSNQDKIRNTNKIIYNEDESPKSVRKCRENRKSCMSSDTETDSLILEKKIDLSPVSPKKTNRESPTKTNRDKQRLPVINDLSVNDESFGIHVAPCPQRNASHRKKSATRKMRANTPRTKETKIETEIVEPTIEKTVLDVVLPIPAPRSSRIPKPTTKSEIVDDQNKKDRERTATVKKDNFKKWRNLSEVSNDELLQMAEDFDFISDIDDLELKIDEADEMQQWEVDAQQKRKKPHGAKDEDDFIVLHVTEPEKLADDDTIMKLSVSEPCFSTNYPEPGHMLRALKKNSGIFVFDTPPKDTRRRSSPRKRSKMTKKVKVVPRLLAIREKTFLANDCPRIKRRKLGRGDETKPKIANIQDYYFGHVTKTTDEIGTAKRSPKKEKRKKFEYFEIKKEEVADEAVKKEIINKKDKRMEETVKDEETSSIPEEEVEKEKFTKKLTICYSDEEFEQLRQKKEKGLTLQTQVEEAEEPQQTMVNDDVAMIDSLEVLNLNTLENIEEEEENQGSAGRNIEIEDFIIKKPNKTNILLKRNDCLDELFPKPREMIPLCSTESTTAVPLSLVVNSVYDLKNADKGSGMKKKSEKSTRLPGIDVTKTKRDKVDNSMSSLVQIWKERKQKMENWSRQEDALWEQMKKPVQIALIPFVLTHKLAEVAGQFHKTKDENYDPFKQAEKQMIALLSWPSTADLKSVNENSQTSPKSQSNRNLETSPTSAFSKYSPKDEKSPKDAKDNANHKRVQTASSARPSQNGKRSSVDYAPVYNAADDWEQIFEKHFDLNRNEMNDKMTRSVKSALDGLLKSYPDDRELSPTRKNRSDLCGDKRPSSRMSEADRKFSYGRTTPMDEVNDSGGRKSNRNSGVSLSSLSFCSQASDTTLADEEIMRTNLEIVGIGKSTPRTSKRRFARSHSVTDERNKMLYAHVFDSHLSSSDENDMLPTIDDLPGRKSSVGNACPKSVPSRFPRSQSVMDGPCRGDGDHFDEREQVSSPETNKNRRAAKKISADSAYSSLNRRSPRSSTKTHSQDDRLSSSGSEHSLPPLNNDQPLKPVNYNSVNAPSSAKQPCKMSKFCHECGSKYPVAVAKFCCECGVRRLIL